MSDVTPTPPVEATPLTPEELDQLEVVARAATPGPWEAADWNLDDGPEPFTVEASSLEVLGSGQSGIWPGGVRKHRVAETEECDRPFEDAAHIAAFDPPTVLRLIAQARPSPPGPEAVELREALEGLLKAYVQLVNCGDCGNWNPEEEDHVILARAALRTSEEGAGRG